MTARNDRRHDADGSLLVSVTEHDHQRGHQHDAAGDGLGDQVSRHHLSHVVLWAWCTQCGQRLRVAVTVLSSSGVQPVVRVVSAQIMPSV